MINELQKDLQLLPRWQRGLRLFLDRALPRGIQEEYADSLKEKLDALEKRPGPALKPVFESASLLTGGYRVQAVAAFNKYACLAEAALVTFCFSVASIPAGMPYGLWLALPVTLSILALRDAYTLQDERVSVLRYYLYSAADAAAAGVFLLVAETLALKVAPSLAFPAPVLYRGAVVCLPLISTLRIVLRTKPDAGTPLKGPAMSAKDISKRTWRLNILWMGTFYGLILQNVSDAPSDLDKLRGFLPLALFGIWMRFQSNGLARRDYIETIKERWDKKILIRHKEILPQGIRRGEAFYWACVSVEAVLFMGLAASLAEVLWPWLSRRDPGAGFLRPAICLVVFATTVVSWKFVKNSNRAAARALQEEIDRMQ